MYKTWSLIDPKTEYVDNNLAKQPSCKNPWKMDRMKSFKIEDGSQELAEMISWWQTLITKIQVNFVPIPSEDEAEQNSPI